MHEKAKVLQILRRIKSGEVKIKPRNSICRILEVEGILYLQRIRILQPLFYTWVYYSGNIRFPVPSTNKKYTCFQYFQKAKNLWRGKQGKFRWSLIDHMITCLENTK